MNSKNSKFDNLWLPCDEGAIVDASTSIRNREIQKSRRQFLQAALTASAVVAGVGFTGWTLLDQGDDQLKAVRNNPNYLGGIACSEVQKYLNPYINDSLNDIELANSIEVHLTECGHCCDIHDAIVESDEVA